MIPEIGHFAIILAFIFALIQSLLFFKKETAVESRHFFCGTVVFGQLFFLSIAMLSLIVCFLQNDLTVLFVREHSHHLLPFLYRVGAAWGGHEGSLLLWCLILSGWTFAFVIFANKNLLRHFYITIIRVLGVISTGFIAFLLFTSNPFKRDFPSSPVIGNDLTPILQDPGLIFHPPMLYLGYVGFAIGFAYAICALIQGKLNTAWAETLRPWIILPWAFLSCGIVLGSWWAYRELGWGGWWFWDPVENASLLPWLAATGLIHSLIVSEKREAFKGWTLLLAIVAFALSLIGTFLVRSGVLVSVHAFASDPTRGIFLLGYLTFIIGGAFILYGCRIHYFYQRPTFQLFSRETLLLINSVIFLTAVATILLGTLYPIILDGLNLEKISVGEPYFNSVFVPIMLPLLVLMGLGPHINWGQHAFKKIWNKLRLAVFLSFFMGFSAPFLFGFSFHLLAACGFSLALWIIFTTLQFILQKKWQGQIIGLKYWSMIVAHLGIAVFVVGVTFNKSYSEERQIKMSPGETTALAGYSFTFKEMTESGGANYQSLLATFSIQKNNKLPKLLYAEQRIYPHDQTLSKTGILANVWRDLYVALGASLGEGAWSVRIYYKPFVRWIWAGGFMLLLGGMLALLSYLPKRETLT